MYLLDDTTLPFCYTLINSRYEYPPWHWYVWLYDSYLALINVWQKAKLCHLTDTHCLVLFMINAQSKVGEMIWSLLVMSWCISWEEGDYCCLPCIVIFKYHAECLWPDIHFICSLPWQGLKAGTKKHKYERISEKRFLPQLRWILLLLASLNPYFALFLELYW